MTTEGIPINLDDRQELDQFLANIDYIVSDCDGVLWLDDKAVVGAAQAYNKLRALGKHILFVTNNDTKTRQEFRDKLVGLGFRANVNEMYPTSYLIAKYLNDQQFRGKVYVIGESGIVDELTRFDIPAILDTHSAKDFNALPAVNSLDPDVAAVVLGMDYSFSFRKCVKACTYIRQRNAVFLASSADESMPNRELTVPGPGAILALIESATGKQAVCLGKPSTLFFDIIRGDYPLIDPNRCVMIGDRLTTDMPFGHNNRMRTLFVESGINTRNDMLAYAQSPQPSHHSFVPHYYMKSLDVFNKYL